MDSCGQAPPGSRFDDPVVATGLAAARRALADRLKLT
jgi:hypothetical protein